MRIKNKRFSEKNGATIGLVTIDGVFECFCLEDAYREKKIMKETRIPAGIYELRLRTYGGFHERYKTAYGSRHKGMIEICGIPNYEAVLFHIGNTKKDTEGCQLLGHLQSEDMESIIKSKDAYLKFYDKVSSVLLKGIKVYYEVIDEDFRKKEK